MRPKPFGCEATLPAVELRVKGGTGTLLMLALVALVVHIAVLQIPGYYFDERDVATWSRGIEFSGTRAAYDLRWTCCNPINYPPGSLWNVWLVALVARAFGLSTIDGPPDFAGQKILPMAADFFLGAIAYRVTNGTRGAGAARIAFGTIAMIPPLVLISASWGQNDAIPVALAALALFYAGRGSVIGSCLAITGAVLVKPYVLPLAPLLVAWYVLVLKRPRALALGIGASSILAYLVSLPFSPVARPDALFAWLAGLYAFSWAFAKATFSQDAFNLYTIAGHFKGQPDSVHMLGPSAVTWASIVVACLTIAIAVVAVRLVRRGADGERVLWEAAFATTFVAVIVGTRMHERYLIIPVVVGAIAACAWRRNVFVMVAFTMSVTVNLALVLFGFPGGRNGAYVDPQLPIETFVAHGLSGLNVVLLVVVLMRFFRYRSTKCTDRPQLTASTS